MCDTYRDDPKLTYGENRIMERMECVATNDQLGHCIVYVDGGWNIPGMAGKPQRKPMGTGRRSR